MIRTHLCRRLVVALAILCPISSSLAVAGDAQNVYYQAYFLEQEKGDFAAAAKLYSQVAAARDVDAELRSQARARLVACREELASSDLLRLMPPDALAYAEWMGDDIESATKSAALTVESLRAEKGNYQILSPQEAIAEIEARGRLQLQPLCGGLPPKYAWESLETLVQDVLPHVKPAQ